MAPRTRRAAARLAAINAEFTQDSSAQVVDKPNQVKDSSAGQESENPHLTDNEEKHIESDDPAAKSPSAVQSITSRNKRQDFSNDPKVVFGPKSKLTKLDMTKFLSDEKTWAALIGEQQAILKAMCPISSAWGGSNVEQPTLGFLLYDMHWKSEVRTYVENMAEGYYHPAWIQDAEKATSKRADGKYDDWKLKNFEEYWGQKMDAEIKEFEGKKQETALSDLVSQGQLQIGDEWSYSRSFGRGKKLTLVEQKFHMTDIDDYGKVHFRIELPSSTKALKRFFDDAVDEDGDNHIPKRIVSGKHVKIMEESEEEQQKNLVVGATSDKSHDDTIDPNLDTIIKDVTNQDDTTAQGALSASEENQITDMASLPDENQAVILTPKSILKKQVMAAFIITVGEVKELEKELLKHGGHDQNPGKSDSWKYFTIYRDGQDIGCLQTLRDEYQEKFGS